MPGSEGCARCGSVLNSATIVMDVNPPRAGAGAKRWRRLVPGLIVIRCRQATEAIAHCTLPSFLTWGTAAGKYLPPWGLIPRLLVPGWAHFRTGQPARGWFFLNTYITFLSLGLLSYGAGQDLLFLGLAVAIHVTAVFDISNQHGPANYDPVPQRIRSVIVTALVMIIVYTPAYIVLTGLAEARVVGTSEGALQPGDVVLVRHWFMRAQPGDLVEYAEQGGEFNQGNEGRERRYLYVQEGENIDRVLAIGPAKAEWSGGRLVVNGEPVAWQPLLPQGVPDGLGFDVPPGYRLILPSGRGLPPDATIWNGFSIVSMDQITGTVYWRQHPLSRMGFIR
jgi:hypothetical protein